VRAELSERWIKRYSTGQIASWPIRRLGRLTDPKGYIPGQRILAPNMRRLTFILLALALLIFGAGAIYYPYPGINSYGPALGYPAYASPLSFPLFAAGNNTTAISAVLLRATELRPEFEVWKNGNGSAYSNPLLPLWSAYTFYLPFQKAGRSFGDYESNTSSIDDFLTENQNRSFATFDTPSVRQFALQDEYHQGVEAHDDPTRMGMSHFLDDDEPPGPPLL